MLILGAGPSLSYLSEFPGPPQFAYFALFDGVIVPHQLGQRVGGRLAGKHGFLILVAKPCTCRHPRLRKLIFPIMASEGLQRRIDRLLDEADDAISKYDWEAVSRDAHAFLAIDPEHSEGLALLATAELALATLAPNPASDSGTTTTTEASISTLGTPEHIELPPPVIGASKAERRQLTVRFCDLQSPTALSQQLDLEELRGVIRSYQDVCAGAVVRFDGYVAKYLVDGRGILIYFGYPQAH